MTGIRIRVTMSEDGKSPTWQLMIGDAVAYTFEGYTELVEHAVQTVSSTRYVAHDVPARMRR
jgi:hypothetical protein